jgi:hypothetical protein
VDVVINLFDGEPRGLVLVAALELGPPILEIKVRLLGYRKDLLPEAALPALGPELILENASFGHR